MATGGTDNLLPLPLVVSRKATCLAMGCHSTRIRKDCGRRMCKAHCCEAGGCADPAHKGSRTTSISILAGPPPSVTLAPVSSALVHHAAAPLNTLSTPTSSIDPNLLQGQVQMALTPVASSSHAPMPVHTEPVFASHISQVFTSQMAREEELRESSRRKEATPRKSKKKVHQTVVVYAWIQVCFSSHHK